MHPAFRLPLRPTVRLRLTLVYGGLFLLTGAMLLAANYLLVRRSLPEVAPVGVVRVLAPAPGAALPGQTFEAPVPATPGVPVRAPFVIEDPVTPDGRPVADVLAEVTRRFRDSTLRQLVTRSAQTLGLMALASVVLGWTVAGRVLRPLHDMTAAARRLSEQNLHERIALSGPDDELKELADTFDAMLARLESAFESQKRFVANASHELRTPLSIIRTEVDVTLADPDAGAEQLRAMAEVVRRATERSDALIDALLVLARSDRGVTSVSPVDLSAVAADALAQADGPAAAAGVTLSARLDPAPAEGDAHLLARLVGNLVENAVRYNEPGGSVEVTTGAGPDGAWIRVENTGESVPPSEVDALFEPFRRRGAARTGDAAPGGRPGVGLGLSIVRSVAAAHGGRVTAETRPGGGLRVVAYLPAGQKG